MADLITALSSGVLSGFTIYALLRCLVYPVSYFKELLNKKA